MKLNSAGSLTKGDRRFSTPVQVAAVCYRRTARSLEFLLVNTSSGKWTFPKGRLSPRLTASQAAAREALEEAGAVGRIEEECLAHYLDLKRALGHRNGSCEIRIAAYMMEVHTLFPSHEADRNPTWFLPEEAKQRLAEQRTARYSLGLGKVIDAATSALNHNETKRPTPPQERSRRLAVHG